MSYTTIGYLQAKMIRTPLSLNREWNAIINGCNTPQELINYISDKGTNDEHWRLLHAIKTRDELNKQNN